MKKQKVLFYCVMLLMALCVSPAALRATEIEPSLRPISTSPAASEPFMATLEEVRFEFDRCIKLYDGASVTIKCDGALVATASGLEVDNHTGEPAKRGTLIAKFNKRNLPKGKTYTVSLSQGSVGWTERYNDIQVVNMPYSFNLAIPETLAKPSTYLQDNSPVEDSETETLCFHYSGCEVAPVGTPMFLLYRDGKFTEEIPASISFTDWNCGEVKPLFPQKTNFDFGIAYSLILPAGSISAPCRDDIVNEELALNFIGYYREPGAPFSFQWCSLFDDRPDVLSEVSFTYSSPVSVVEGAEFELYEGDCETLLQSVPAYLNTDINCWMVCCDFGGFRMTSEKGYTIVVPDDAVFLQQFPDIKATGGKVKIPGAAGITDVTTDAKNDATLYDLTGRIVKNPTPGNLYIRNGRKYLL